MLLLHFLQICIFGSRSKNVLDVGASLGRSFKVGSDFVDPAELAGLFFLNDALVFKVSLAPYQEHSHVGRRVLFDLLQPVAEIGERLFSGNVKSKKDDLRAAVEDSRDRPERLLAGSVPDLQLGHLSI